jgi:hypothetical protein
MVIEAHDLTQLHTARSSTSGTLSSAFSHRETFIHRA